MDLLIATGNSGKVKEFETLLDGLDIRLLSLKDFPGYQPPEETGSSFRENALIKAKAALDYTGITCIADDSGLVVPALGGEPGIYSSRYSGPDATSEENNKKLLSAMKDIDGDDRSAYFIAVLCLLTVDNKPYYAEGRCDGLILREKTGDMGFGYDPLFQSTELKKSMAELSMEEKNLISHRGKAMKSILPAIKDIII